MITTQNNNKKRGSDGSDKKHKLMVRRFKGVLDWGYCGTFKEVLDCVYWLRIENRKVA